jgi:MFS family permease
VVWKFILIVKLQKFTQKAYLSGFRLIVVDDLLCLIPYKLIFAAYSFLPPLMILSMGKGAVEVGLVSAVHLLGLFFGPLVWSKFAPVANRKYMVIFGYLGLFSGLLLLANPSLIYLAVFILAFFPPAAYFAVLAEVKRKKGSLGAALGKLEQLSGVAWALGLLLGFFGIQMLSLSQLSLLLASLTLISLPLVALAVGSSMSGAFVNGFKELGNLRMWVISTGGITKVAVPKLKVARKALSLYFFGAIFALSSGLTFPQMPTFLKQVFNAPSLIYLCYFVDAAAAAALYGIAGRARHKAYLYGYFLRILAYVALLASTHFSNLPLLLLFYLVEGLAWGYIMMFFEYSGLKLGEEIYGTQLSIRLLLYSITSAASGFIVETVGFMTSFVAGLALFVSTILFYNHFRKEIEKEKNGATQSGSLPSPQ